jgi:hypothetical protein
MSIGCRLRANPKNTEERRSSSRSRVAIYLSTFEKQEASFDATETVATICRKYAIPASNGGGGALLALIHSK